MTSKTTKKKPDTSLKKKTNQKCTKNLVFFLNFLIFLEVLCWKKNQRGSDRSFSPRIGSCHHFFFFFQTTHSSSSSSSVSPPPPPPLPPPSSSCASCWSLPPGPEEAASTPPASWCSQFSLFEFRPSELSWQEFRSPLGGVQLARRHNQVFVTRRPI